VRRALAAVAARDLRLYPDPLCWELRARIARIHGVSIERVFVGNGSDEILALSTRAFVEDDGSIGAFEPSYSLYPVLAAIRNVRYRPVELDADFQWRMPERYQCSLFLLASPNAPTGILYPKPAMEAFCRRMRGVVLIDEAYVDFARRHCMGLARRLPNVLVMRTVSKSFSLAGLRVGYAVGAAPLVEALFKLKDSYNVDRVAQALALAALEDLPHMRRNAARIRATRRRLADALGRLGFRVFPSDANFLWVRPPVAAERLFRALRARGILVRHFPGRRTGDYLRVTVGTDEETARLANIAAELLEGRNG
jgi:histidinol-phosphate aminotransferase